METLANPNSITLLYDKQKNLIISRVKTNSEFRTSDQMREDIEISAKMIEQYRPLYYLNNQKDNKYTYKVEEQRWIAMTFANTATKVGLKKLALVYPEELIAELALQQTVEEAGKVPFEIQYFSEESEAMQWIEQ